MSVRKRRKDYITLHRRIFKMLKINRMHMTIPYSPIIELSNKDIARMLGVNGKTIRRHKKNITPKQWQKIKSASFRGVWDTV